MTPDRWFVIEASNHGLPPWEEMEGDPYATTERADHELHRMRRTVTSRRYRTAVRPAPVGPFMVQARPIDGGTWAGDWETMPGAHYPDMPAAYADLGALRERLSYRDHTAPSTRYRVVEVVNGELVILAAGLKAGYRLEMIEVVTKITSEYQPCDKPDCERWVSASSAHCCAPCADAAEGRYEIHAHSEGCDQRWAARQPAEA